MKLTNSSGATTYFTDYADSTSDGNAPISVTLGAGSYTLSVSDYASDSATYIMTYWTGAPAVGTSSTNNAGTSLATARNIGTPSAAGDSYADWVGPADPDDYYQFTLTSASLVSLSLTGQSTNYLLLKLLNVAGSQIANSYETAVSGGGILTYLAAGTYFIDVNSDNDTSGYSLLAQSTALPNQAGSGLGSALNIGALSTTVSYNDFVGSVDTDDYYEFTIGSPSSLSVTLSNLSENTELILRDVSGNSLAYTYGAFQSASTYGAFQSNASLIADLAAGTYFIDVNSDGYTGTTYTISLNATAFADTGGPTISSAAPLGAALGTTPLADGFSSPSQSNLLLQNASTGAIDILSVAPSGLVVTAALSLGDPGSTWHVVGSADLNGDGQPDILLQADNGTIVDYLMSGTSIAYAFDLGDAGSSWHVRGLGNFDNSGNASILLQSDSGGLVVWETNGVGITGTASLGTLPAGWAVEGVGDFYGTGQSDILLQSNTGTLVIYSMSGTTITGAAAIGTPLPGWTVAGTGNFNGDFKTDILLHSDSGANVVWEMSGTTLIGATSLGDPGTGYTDPVAGLDLNGDGISDVVLQSNSTSTIVEYLLNNTAQITSGTVLGSPGSGWQVLGNNPTTFIDGTGTNLNLTGTPGPDEFNFTSYVAGLHIVSSFDPATDLIALSAAAFPTYAAVQAHETAYQGGTFIGLTNTAAIDITGVTPSQLTAANFVLR
jgi:hypothetical protein